MIDHENESYDMDAEADVHAGMDVDMLTKHDAHAALVDVLVTYGVMPHDAITAVRRMAASSSEVMSPTTFTELYGSGNVKAAASIYGHLNIDGLNVLDLRAIHADGHHWDSTKASHRKEARQKIADENPDWVIGAPPCGPFSMLNWNNNFKRMTESEIRRVLTQGRCHLSFAAQIYRDQHARGKFFLHEHPATAESWKEEVIKRLLKLPGVGTTIADQCMFNSMTLDADGVPGLARKPTRFASNSRYMLEELSCKCDRSHEHVPLEGRRARMAAIYPFELLLAILRGIARTRDALEAVSHIQSDEYDAVLSLA